MKRQKRLRERLHETNQISKLNAKIKSRVSRNQHVLIIIIKDFEKRLISREKITIAVRTHSERTDQQH